MAHEQPADDGVQQATRRVILPVGEQTEDEIRASMKDEAFAAAILNWHPTGSRLLLREVPRPMEQKFGAIITPDNRQKRGRECVLIAAGPDADYEIGTHLICGTYQGVIIDLAPGVTVLLIEGDEVLMTFDDSPPPAVWMAFPYWHTFDPTPAVPLHCAICGYEKKDHTAPQPSDEEIAESKSHYQPEHDDG